MRRPEACGFENKSYCKLTRHKTSNLCTSPEKISFFHIHNIFSSKTKTACIGKWYKVLIHYNI